jgi:hypothetical protein
MVHIRSIGQLQVVVIEKIRSCSQFLEDCNNSDPRVAFIGAVALLLSFSDVSCGSLFRWEESGLS